MPIWTYHSLKYGGSGAPATWKPSDSPGLSDWFTASYTPSVTTPNGNVTSWTTRRSGGTNNLATAVGTPTHDGSSINFLNGSHALSDTSIDNGAISNGSCMLYVVCDTDKVASHYIVNYDVATANPGLGLRYWQPTDSWFAYCDSTASVANVSASAAGTAASQKVLLGVRVNGTTLSISVNGTVTTGGVAAAPFTATRLYINKTGTSLGRVYDIGSFTTYDAGTAQRLEGFLAHKHGITLANGHPYRLSPPTLEWVPTDDSGLTIWYDFADSSTITVTGAGISDLKNKKDPATYNLTQSTDAERPTWDGSVATGRGNAATSSLGITTSVSWTNAAYNILAYCILPNNSASQSQRIYNVLTSGVNSHLAYVLQNSNELRLRTNNAGSATYDSVALTGYTAPRTSLLGFKYDGATTKEIWTEGTRVINHTDAGNTATTGTIFRLLNYSSISLGDFLVTSTTSTAIRQKYEGWLAWKRGIASSLPSDHPYKSRPPLTTD